MRCRQVCFQLFAHLTLQAHEHLLFVANTAVLDRDRDTADAGQVNRLLAQSYHYCYCAEQPLLALPFEQCNPVAADPEIVQHSAFRNS